MLDAAMLQCHNDNAVNAAIPLRRNAILPENYYNATITQCRNARSFWHQVLRHDRKRQCDFATAQEESRVPFCSNAEALNGWLPQCWLRQCRNATMPQRLNWSWMRNDHRITIFCISPWWLLNKGRQSQRCHKNLVYQFFIKNELTAVEGNSVENASVSARTNNWITHCRNAGCGHVAMPQWQCRPQCLYAAMPQRQNATTVPQCCNAALPEAFGIKS